MDALNARMVDLVADVAPMDNHSLGHDATLTKSRSDVCRPKDAFRNIVDAKLLNRASLHRLFRCAPTSWLPTRSPRAAPMFRVLRPRFTASSMPSCSTVRLSIAKGLRLTIQAQKAPLRYVVEACLPTARF